MSVEDWALKQSPQISLDGTTNAERAYYRRGMTDGIVLAFDALLSDEACDEIAKVVWGSMLGNDRIVVRAASAGRCPCCD